MINLDNIHIILSRTRHPGNIGAAARAMMNFGFKNMILIDPVCKIDSDAYAKARYSAHIFENARRFASLDEIKDEFPLIIGTSRRGSGRLNMRMSPKAFASELAGRYKDLKIGILFGDEKYGLSNEELEKCAWYITIPTDSEFESLNLANSVAIVAYEIFSASDKVKDEIIKDPASPKSVEQIYAHAIEFLAAAGFPTKGSPERVYTDVKRLISSADLKRTDAQLIHGLLRFIEYKIFGKCLDNLPSDAEPPLSEA